MLAHLNPCRDNYDSDDASIEEEGKPLTQDELRTRLGKKAVRATVQAGSSALLPTLTCACPLLLRSAVGPEDSDHFLPTDSPDLTLSVFCV